MLENFDMKLEEMEVAFALWARRMHTPLGRLAVVKSLLLSLLTHLPMVVPNPPIRYLKLLTNKLLQFVWAGPNKIALKRICNTLNEGGLVFINIEHFWKALKISWFRRAMGSDDPWTKCLEEILEKHGIKSVNELLRTPDLIIQKK